MPEPLEFKDAEGDPYRLEVTPHGVAEVIYTGEKIITPDCWLSPDNAAAVRDWLDLWLQEQAPESPDKE